MELEAQVMMENKICLCYESKEEPNNDSKHKSWDMLLVDKDWSNDDVILMMYDEQQEKKEIDTIEMIDSNQKSASSDKVSKLTMNHEWELMECGVELVEVEHSN